MPAPRHVLQTHIRASAEAGVAGDHRPGVHQAVLPSHGHREHVGVGGPWRMTMADGSEAVCGEIEDSDPPSRLVMTWTGSTTRRWRRSRPAGSSGADGERRRRHQGDDGPSRLGLSPATSTSVARLELGPRLDEVIARTGDHARWRGGAGPPRRRGDGDLHRWASTPTTRHGSCSVADELRPEEATNCWVGRTPPPTTGGGPPGRQPEHAARAAWLIARAHVMLGHGELALHHAERCWAVDAGGRTGRLRSRLRTRGASAGVGLPRARRRSGRRAGRRP